MPDQKSRAPVLAALAVAAIGGSFAAGNAAGKPDKPARGPRPTLVEVYDTVSSEHLNALAIVPRRIECPPPTPSVLDAGTVSDAGPPCEPRDVLTGSASFAVPSNVDGDIDPDPRARGGIRKHLVRLEGELPPELGALVPQLAQASLQEFVAKWCGEDAPPHDFACPEKYEGVNGMSIAWCKAEAIGAAATDEPALCFLGSVVGVIRPEPPPDAIARGPRGRERRPTNTAPTSLMLSAQDTAVVQNLIDAKLLPAWCKGDPLCPATDGGTP